MLDYLPFEIQVEIMKRLAVKLLIQLRLVSKAWKNLIDSSDFIAQYRGQQQHLLVAYEGVDDDIPNYVSFVDDHTFPQQRVSPTVPLLVNMLEHSFLDIIGSSHGLLCLHGVCPKTQTDIVVIWNPSITRAIAVVMPNVVYKTYETVFGFGVCGATTDPKILKITQIIRRSSKEAITSIPCQVEVFALSTGVWRPPYSSNLPRKSITFDWWLRVTAGGFIYWIAEDRITMDGGHTSYNLIMAFDITTEEFRQVNFPHSLAHESRCNMSMSKLKDKLKESLVVLQGGVEADNPVTFVWMMEDGVPNLFTKLFTFNVNTPDAGVNTPAARVRGFRKSGEPILEIREDELPYIELFVYDPNSKHFDSLGISGIACSSLVHPYMETLLLLDQPNLTAYNEMETIRFLEYLAS